MLKTVAYIGRNQACFLNSSCLSDRFRMQWETRIESVIADAASIKTDGIIFDAPTLKNIELPDIVHSLRMHFANAALFVLKNPLDISQEIALLNAGADCAFVSQTDYTDMQLNILAQKMANAINRRAVEIQPKSLQKKSKVVEIDGLLIDHEKHSIRLEEQYFDRMPFLEFEILFLLVKSPGMVFSRQEIIDRVWRHELVIGDERSVDTRIKCLRRHLKKHGFPDLIETVYGQGYQFRSPEENPSSSPRQTGKNQPFSALAA